MQHWVLLGAVQNLGWAKFRIIGSAKWALEDQQSFDKASWGTGEMVQSWAQGESWLSRIRVKNLDIIVGAYMVKGRHEDLGLFGQPAFPDWEAPGQWINLSQGKVAGFWNATLKAVSAVRCLHIHAPVCICNQTIEWPIALRGKACSDKVFLNNFLGRIFRKFANQKQ